MKKNSVKILSGVALATILSTSMSASESFFDVGYASADVEGVSQSGASVGFGVNFGETLKQSFGLKVAFLGDGNEANEDRGNIGDIYYNLGYEVLPNTIAYASVGYGFQSLGTVGTGQNATTAYSGGMSLGGGVKYNLGENFAVDASYKNYSLSYEALDYDAKVANLSLVYRFGKK